MNDLEMNQALRDRVREIRARINEGSPLESLLEELGRMQGLIEDLAAQVRVLRAQRSLRDLLLPEAQVAFKGINHVRIDAAQPLAESQGFYAMEYDAFGQSFRWTGPRPVFHFDLHLDRSAPLRLRVGLAKGFGARAKSLRAFVDGVELPLESADSPTRTDYAAVLLPREFLGLTRVAFMPTEMFRPAALPGQEDQRVLGVVFRDLSIEPTSQDEADDYLRRCDVVTQIRLATPSATGDGDVLPLPPPPVLQAEL